MKSLSFPEIFNNSSTKTISDHEATMSNLKLLLLSEKSELFGDPYFGTNLKKLLFEPNNVILQDLVIDDIYTAILTFIPQLTLKRSDITVTHDGVNLLATIKCTNLIDYELDTYTINLTDESIQ